MCLSEFGPETRKRVEHGERFMQSDQLTGPNAALKSMHQKLVVGAVAGIIGTSCIFPIDVVKTRLQNNRPDPKTGKLRYQGILHTFRSIVAKEGARSLYKGIGANLVGVTPEKAIKLAANDFFREQLTDAKTGELSPRGLG